MLKDFLKGGLTKKGWLHLPFSSQSSDTTGSYIVALVVSFWRSPTEIRRHFKVSTNKPANMSVTKLLMKSKRFKKFTFFYCLVQLCPLWRRAECIIYLDEIFPVWVSEREELPKMSIMSKCHIIILWTPCLSCEALQTPFFRWLSQLLQLVWILLSFTETLCEMHRENLWTVCVDPGVWSFSIQLYWVKSTVMLVEQTRWRNNGLRQPSSKTLNMKHGIWVSQCLHCP